MPAVGDQHRRGPGMSATSTTANPFDDTQRISEYTAQDIATLQSRLNKQLGPEYLSSRQGPGGQRVHYISADKCINLANEVFGFNGWSSSIQNIQVDFVDEDPNTGKISLGLSVIMRVTLKDGAYHEDVGYGHIENCKGKAAAFEKAKKEGTTDGLKRALRTFGKVLGNCIYDKEYLSRVTKVKAIPTKWDVDSLHRHSSFGPVRQEQPAPPAACTEKETRGVPAPQPPSAPTGKGGLAEFEGEFGSDLFDEADFSEQHTSNPDEVVLDQHSQPQNFNGGPPGPQGTRGNPVARAPVHLETPSKPQRTGPILGGQSNLPPPANRVARPNIPPGNPISTPLSKPPVAGPPRPPTIPQNNTRVPQNPNPTTSLPHNPAGQPAIKPQPTHSKEATSSTKLQSPLSSQAADKQPEDIPTGFFSARAAEVLNTDPQSAIKVAPAFDPRFESPSIRKTAGFNHRTSAPVVRNTYQILPPQLQKTTTSNPSHIPPASQSGRASAPGPINNTAFASPLQKAPLTSSYRPPMRRNITVNNNANTNMNTGPNAPAAVPNGAQNANGKRPPLSDMTNATPGSGDEKRSNADAIKRSRVGDPGAGTIPTNQQGQQPSR